MKKLFLFSWSLCGQCFTFGEAGWWICAGEVCWGSLWSKGILSDYAWHRVFPTHFVVVDLSSAFSVSGKLSQMGWLESFPLVMLLFAFVFTVLWELLCFMYFQFEFELHWNVWTSLQWFQGSHYLGRRSPGGQKGPGPPTFRLLMFFYY